VQGGKDVIRTFAERMKGGGQSPPRKPLSKIAWSWLGAFVGIYLVSLMSKLTHADMLNSFFVVGSFGASAVLIYGARMGLPKHRSAVHFK
jgi:hypothetical protein